MPKTLRVTRRPKMRGMAAAGLTLMAALGPLAAPVSAITAAQLCESAMENAVGKFAKGRLKAAAVYAKTGDGAKYSTALGKCSTKLQTTFARVTAKYGASCPATEPESDFESYVAQCSTVAAIAAGGGTFPACGDGTINVAGEQCDGAALGGETCSSLGLPSGSLGCDSSCQFDTAGCAGACMNRLFPATGQTTCWNSAGTVIPCAGTGNDGEVQAGATLAYTDNGDGTITDNNTGLMWEKLSDNGGIHDWDNTYSLDDAVGVKMAALNGGAGFGGHTDWRVPNIKELQSIVDYQIPNPGPVVPAAFNNACVPGCTVLTCSCTRSMPTTPYWSSTTYPISPDQAWQMRFNLGIMTTSSKTDDYPVRAVRGGS